MIRARLLLAGVLVAAMASTAVAGARGPTAHSATTATIELRESNLGEILVNSAGFTLFYFTADKKHLDHCVTVSGCPKVWPVLESSGTPTVGPGLNARRISTITLPGGERQVTYARHPLYTYSFEKAPAETSYVGAEEFGGRWYALNAKGKTVN